ncbi:MAG: PhzF family phenazine biosynthesis protein [Deltaproteobacteria bacterium]|nr:PhzF family phenazine biosynthesis protein [Deltaproteobacteria bacterium]
MKLPIFQVDAFSGELFGGNPAAVCPLPHWLDDERLTSIAAENNLSETAFVVPDGDDWELRWFTPTAEVDLCGHATLATAFVLFRDRPEAQRLRFRTREEGVLTVERHERGMQMDFPTRPATLVETPPGLADALGGVEPVVVLRAASTMAVFDSEATVRGLLPYLGYVANMDGDGLIVTAPGDTADFVSRYFAPHVGIDEDPVTGSTHCTLAPYWAQRLNKSTLHAQQVSRRGGALSCTIAGDRVLLVGQAVLYLEGTIEVPD